jgi:hypothetical protein
MHDEAFDLYCAGLSRSRIADALRERHGQQHAPCEATLYRWQVNDHWILRRSYIRSQALIMDDRRRAREQAPRLRQLASIQDHILSSADKLPCRSGGEAVRALARLQRIMDQLAGECPDETTHVPPDTLQHVVKIIFDFLQEDPELAPILESRWHDVLRRLDLRFADEAFDYE